jgi:hypothetical protein
MHYQRRLLEIFKMFLSIDSLNTSHPLINFFSVERTLVRERIQRIHIFFTLRLLTGHEE